MRTANLIALLLFLAISILLIIRPYRYFIKPFEEESNLMTEPRVFSLYANLLSISKIKIENNDIGLIIPYRALLNSATKLLEKKPYSVTYKMNILTQDRNIHEYTSIRPFVWLDTNGMYINIDGKVNPESLKFSDYKFINEMAEDTFVLSLTYYFSNDERYAQKAINMLDTWFLDEKTKMYPNFNYAQSFPDGRIGDGGCIDGHKLPLVIDAVGLLSRSHNWTDIKQKGMEKWFEQLFMWFTTTELQIKESNFKNNHGTWCDVQTVAMALFLGKNDIAKRVVEDSKTKRISIQIEPDGRQPFELDRINSYHYSVYNLYGLFKLARLGTHVGVDLWNYNSSDGRNLKNSLDFLIPYASNDSIWPYKQVPNDPVTISEINDRLADIIQEARLIYNSSEYTKVLSKMNLLNKNKSIRNLLYPIY